MIGLLLNLTPYSPPFLDGQKKALSLTRQSLELIAGVPDKFKSVLIIRYCTWPYYMKLNLLSESYFLLF